MNDEDDHFKPLKVIGSIMLAIPFWIGGICISVFLLGGLACIWWKILSSIPQWLSEGGPMDIEGVVAFCFIVGASWIAYKIISPLIRKKS